MNPLFAPPPCPAVSDPTGCVEEREIGATASPTAVPSAEGVDPIALELVPVRPGAQLREHGHQAKADAK